MLPVSTERKNSSGIWTMMTKTSYGLARCNICNREFKCDKGTSNVLRHLKNNHNKSTDEYKAKNDAQQGSPKSKSYISLMLPAGRKNSSGVWGMMTKTSAGLARCNICNHEFRYDNGTSNMLKHVQRHNKSGDEIKPSEKVARPKKLTPDIKPFGQIIPTTSASGVTKHKPLSVRKNALDQKLLAMIYKDMQPFSIVEDPGFRDLCREMDPRYEIPSRRQLKEALPMVYDEIKETLINSLGQVDSVAITIDSWTSINMESFLTITAHFLEPFPSWKLHSTVLATRQEDKSGSSAAGMAEIITEVLEEFNIKDKVASATTDNTSSMVSLVRDHLKVLHVLCLAHSLNLIVKDAIKATYEFSSLIEDVKAIVNYFHKSTKATAKLKLVLTEMKMKEQKLCQQVPTRWNSTLKMLRRYVELHQAVSGALMALDKSDLIISDQEVQEIKTCCESLEPFEQATDLMSAEKMTSLSQILVVVSQLQHFLKNETTQTPLSSNLQTEISLRFPNPEENFTLAAATLLDPRFKRLPFVDERLRQSHEESIINMMRPLYTTTDDEESPENETLDSTSPSPSKYSFMESFVARVKQAEKVVPQYRIGPREEFQRFMEMKHLDIKRDPNVWWHEHADLFPHLSTVARKFLFIPATSVPSERLFSKAGELVSRKKSCLNSSTLDMVLFLSKQQCNV